MDEENQNKLRVRRILKPIRKFVKNNRNDFLFYYLVISLIGLVLLTYFFDEWAYDGITVESVEIGDGTRATYALPNTFFEESQKNRFFLLPGIILFHDYCGERESMLPFIRSLTRAGFATLAVEMQGHGASLQWLHNTTRSGLKAVQYLKDRREVDGRRVGILGHGLGGDTMLNVIRLTQAIDRNTENFSELSSTLPEFLKPIYPPSNPQHPLKDDISYSRNHNYVKSGVAIGVTIKNDPSLWISDSYVKENMTWGVNSTLPVNLMFANGKFEEIVSMCESMVHFAQMVGVSAESEVELGKVYGNFRNDTGRQIITPKTDHLFEILNHAIMQGAIDWFTKTLEPDARVIVEGTLQFHEYVGYSAMSLLAGICWISLGLSLLYVFGDKSDTDPEYEVIEPISKSQRQSTTLPDDDDVDSYHSDSGYDSNIIDEENNQPIRKSYSDSRSSSIVFKSTRLPTRSSAINSSLQNFPSLNGDTYQRSCMASLWTYTLHIMIHSILLLVSFLLGSPLMNCFPMGHLGMFVGWWVVGSLLFGLRIYIVRNKRSSLAAIMLTPWDNGEVSNFAWTSLLLSALALLAGSILPLQLLFFFRYYDFRFVLPLFSPLYNWRYLAFASLWPLATFFFCFEIEALIGMGISRKHYDQQNKLTLGNLLRNVIARTFFFVVALVVLYVPLFSSEHQLIADDMIGYSSFFVVALVPMITILSFVDLAIRSLGYSNLCSAVFIAGILTWNLAANLPYQKPFGSI